MNFSEELNKKADEVEKIVYQYLPKEEGYQKTILEAMNYSIQAGGKRLRPMLMLETFRLCGGKDDSSEKKELEYFMAAQEMIHTYSLVHDDLPAMDNDEYRRGKKTTHAVYGEAMAILAGDGLLNFAYETACNAFNEKTGNPNIGRALQILSNKAGIYGMVGGQTVDVESEKKGLDITEGKLLYIHEHKTAALIQSAMMIGAVLAGADKKTIANLERCAYDIGIAFQIQDDILDIIGSQDVLGKPIGSDEKNGKVTYVSIYGMDKAKNDVKRLSTEALDILKSLSGEDIFLEELVKWLITREK